MDSRCHGDEQFLLDFFKSLVNERFLNILKLIFKIKVIIHCEKRSRRLLVSAAA